MTTEKFNQFARLAGELPVNEVNTELLTIVLGEVPEIDCYAIADEELNRALNKEQRDGFFEDIEDEIKNLKECSMYKGNWNSSDYFNWSSFTYTEHKDGNYTATKVAEALRDQRPYIDNNMQKTIYYYYIKGIEDYPNMSLRGQNE